jgi:hypothetical protein
MSYLHEVEGRLSRAAAAADDFAEFTQTCIRALDERATLPGPLLAIAGRGPTPVYDETAAYLAAPPFSEVVDSYDEPDPPGFWLPLLGWCAFAFFVALLVWAATT